MGRWKPRFTHMAQMAFVLILSGCDLYVAPDFSAGQPGSVAEPQPETPPRSEESLALSRYYLNVQEHLLSQGLLRTDPGASVQTIGERLTAQSFERIALYDEYVYSNGQFLALPQKSVLRRWSAPIGFSVQFGATVEPEKRRRDLRSISQYVSRLAQITGHPMRMVVDRANFHVLILNEDERRAIEPRLRELIPGIDAGAVQAVVDLPRSRHCVMLAFTSAETPHVFQSAVAVIRAEHPDLLRQSCIHEEIAQGLGLVNDSSLANSSIFNDNDEFALLTQHDEFLLGLLYDDRLSPGMSPESARPILSEILNERFASASNAKAL